jgi:ABC-type antimicrobial peptide transport system permease subunit
LFGVVAHDVARRRAELGLRIALGADPRRILGLTLLQGGALVGAGLAIGALLSLWVARALSTMLFAIRPLDPVSLGLAAAVLLVAGGLATLPAALRAARLDPLLVIRSE